MIDRQGPSNAPHAFALADAARALRADGHLLGVVEAVDGRWTVPSGDDVAGAFAGALLDSRAATSGTLFVGLRGARHDGREFAPQALAAGAHALVGPGPGGPDDPARALDLPVPAPARGVVLVAREALAALECLAAWWRARQPALVIGVTGTNGKTTTKDLLAAVCAAAGPVLATRGNLNSREGVPVTLLGLRPDHRHAVIEMGASAVGHIAARAALARPRIGVITNAAPAHLEEFGSLEQVISGKGEMVAGLPSDGVAILNADSPGFASWRVRATCRVVSWGHRAGDHRWDWQAGDAHTPGWLLLDGDRWPVPLPGRHNAANLCAAILAARAAGLDDATIRGGLAGFQPSPHRAALRRLAGRLVLDDCYNANPESMRQAGRMLVDLPGPGRTWAVLGHMAELGADSDALHRACGRDLAALGIDHLLPVGPAAQPLAEGFGDAGGTVTPCADHAAAAALLEGETRAGDRILVKGSRSAAMERVLEALASQWGWTEARS